MRPLLQLIGPADRLRLAAGAADEAGILAGAALMLRIWFIGNRDRPWPREADQPVERRREPCATWNETKVGSWRTLGRTREPEGRLKHGKLQF